MRGRLALSVVTAVLAAIAIAVTLLPPPVASGEEFQRMMGGLGLGPAVDLSRCAGEFDPRLSSRCSLRHDPLPGAQLFCPAHAGRPR